MAITPNYVLIQRSTLSVAASTVTFSSIPQTGYTDLKIVWAARGTDNTSYNVITFNGSGGSGRVFYAETSAPTVASFTQANIQPIIGQTYPAVTANTYANAEMYIPNYAATGVSKSVLIDGVTANNSTSGVIGINAYLTTTTSGITTIAIKEGGSGDSGTFLAGSTFSIYGIAKVNVTPTNVPKASGGDIVVNDGTYWYHAFLSSGTFAPQKTLSCDYLVVAGGGAGGAGSGGGGGAGGLIYSTSSSFAASNYAVTVGAGGAGGYTTLRGIAGSNSSINTSTAIGGGGGGNRLGGATQGDGGSGGSGGGGATDGYNGGSATSGQGNVGGNSPGAQNPGGGGGGAGAAGQIGGSSNPSGGDGGVGLAYTAFGSATATGQLSGGNYYYAGGGGGSFNTTGTGEGGLGGGGSNGGANNTSGNPGTANTGGGGGASTANSPYQGGSGGSGIVIVRYTMA